MTSHSTVDLFSTRRAGVLLHPTSLPGTWGVLGESARNFVDFLADSGLSIWQTLPIGPTHRDLSPYQSLSAHAGNPDFMDLSELLQAGLLIESELAQSAADSRPQLLSLAAQRFFNNEGRGGSGLDQADYQRFRAINDYWLDDFCLFGAIREVQDSPGWLQWPETLRDRDVGALQAFIDQNQPRLARIRFEQFLFHHQWQSLRDYARGKGVLLFGDIPIFVAHDSADVWANRDLFKLNQKGEPTVVAGVPPDYFSPHGQHWGNPLYNWEAMAVDGYQWWLERLESQRHLFDLIRIDHFRGLQAYWEIPAETPEPIHGYWVPGPGSHFLEACFSRFPDLPLVAENLGIISDDVEELRRRFRLPGMTVMQFGFDGSPDNPHLLHNHHSRDLVYTGTHDNDTTLGWYQSLDERTRRYVNAYLGVSGEDMPWPVIEAAFRSVCSLAIVPMQDFMGLGTEARFNTPGTVVNNWIWQLDWNLCPGNLSARIAESVQRHGRLLQA
ncbi:4-alpha-glucanotransferase [Marinobacter sp. TBZ242]|uniref:4-alpha-glucanotransferase n=1 Tax=Marinobacter azerbaijanicus TaxID=3050455 RepID=A0ABT7I614_9GAMM|nr:4-alpha-glucanotransferase [Marinobacter sp. TBZ242]MDL0429511.1 4-alpha-glucanotransferase [Marinobacter sp. TBZ242]